jgi:hypothetical protein
MSQFDNKGWCGHNKEKDAKEVQGEVEEEVEGTKRLKQMQNKTQV